MMPEVASLVTAPAPLEKSVQVRKYCQDCALYIETDTTNHLGDCHADPPIKPGAYSNVSGLNDWCSRIVPSGTL